MKEPDLLPITGSFDEDVLDEEDIHPSDFEFDTIEEDVPWYRRLQIVLARIKSTRMCFGIYIGMALTCGVVFVFAAFGPGHIRNHLAFTISEALINLLLVLEVAADIIITGKDYWTRIGNVIDFITTLACIVFFFTFMEEDRNAFDDDIPALNAVLLGFRYAFQLFRAMLCAIRGHNTMQIIAQDEVAVHDLELQNMVEQSRESPDSKISRHDDGMHIMGTLKHERGLSGFRRDSGESLGS
mmetsp:Transcript_29796/g.52314  ORF Transcript_29796/g.52314 Transcript_29796/m.52314 type:complete len:241 (-) Transcript_29796:178-900(-)